MTRRRRAWLAVAVLFGLGNVAGAIMAAIGKEPAHTATHVVLAILAAYVARLLVVYSPDSAELPDGQSVVATADRLNQLELSVGGLALGVERMGDAQRQITRLFAERGSEPEHPEHAEHQEHAE